MSKSMTRRPGDEFVDDASSSKGGVRQCGVGGNEL